MIATENPVEHEGTYPLPEAQLDRFMFKLLVGYPSFEQETEVLARHHRGLDPHDVVAAGVRPVANAADLAAARAQVDLVDVEPTVLQYIVALCRATRESPSVELGRVAPRRGVAAARVQGLGVAVGPDLRDARTRSRPSPSPPCATEW